ncbi:MAG: hypothetical protein IKT08_01180 [Bacteroidales bacterium]|nr:hypothetical protein [Bacteroidales bacterium]
MIDIQTKIHDQFSIEFKIGFSGREGVKADHFDVNSWIFLPNGLDINQQTYSKDRFFSDMKSNIRLITPAFSMKEMVTGEASPLHYLGVALKEVLEDASPERMGECEFQLKLFGSIFKSAIRNEATRIRNHTEESLLQERCLAYASDARQVLKAFRDLFGTIRADNSEITTKFGFADEFMSHQVEIRTMRILKALNRSHPNSLEAVSACLIGLLTEEAQYKKKCGYSRSIIDDEDNNRRLLSRHSLLKKYIESALFLRVNTTQDGTAVKQISFSLAAGLAMMVSLLVTMPFQKYLGNYPSLIFVILVLIYMIKDRIKDLTRGLFAYQLKDKYFDTKTVVSIKEKPIGWIKEGMDFILDDKVPEEVLKYRNRSKLEADNNLLEEKIILYRKKVKIDNELLRHHYVYDFKGINDIMRYHINFLTKKMDNPESVIDCLDENLQLQTITAERVYTLHFVLQFKWEDHVEYQAFHVMVNRNGITAINTNENED